MNITQIAREIAAADTLAHRICGCATAEQHKSDIAAILEYREAAFNAGRASAADVAPLVEASKAVFLLYKTLADSGDAGNWDCEKEQEVINYRQALTEWESKHGRD